MITKKEQELKPMEFADLTADYIMSQEWRCDNNSSAVRMNDCNSVVLCPNHLFTTDVVKELCERICEEHNQNLHRNAPQWSQEPPTEKGLYWLFYEGKRVLVEIYYDGYVNECGLYVKTLAAGWSGFSHRLDTFVCNEPHLQWCKVTPPPLPTEGRAE